MNENQIKLYLINNRNRTEPFNSVSDYLGAQKKQFQNNKDEESANKFLIYEECLLIQNIYETSFLTLKKKKYYDAWCALERGEIKILSIKRHLSQHEKKDYHIDFIERIIMQYQSIYPYKLFLSPEIIEHEKRCNICNKIVSIRNFCGHEPGEIYNGEFCYRIVEKADFIGAAIVEKPAQKYSVPFMKDPKTNETVDHYNYSPVEYLIDRLQDPYDDWSIERSKHRYPHERFSDLSRNAKCPCSSGKKYKKCCLRKDYVELDHIEYRLDKLPNDINLLHNNPIIV